MGIAEIAAARPPNQFNLVAKHQEEWSLLSSFCSFPGATLIQQTGTIINALKHSGRHDSDQRLARNAPTHGI
jgi:hypothetical protein